METAQPAQQKSVLNPGHNRYGLSTAWTPPPHLPFLSAPLADVLPKDPWRHLQWWEAPWQAKEGIKSLCARPFLYLPEVREVASDVHEQVPIRVLYPYALRSSEEDCVQHAAHLVASCVRQAREFYSAATSAGVSELTRPVLYFYGALSLAKAAVVSMFGVESLNSETKHGLDCVEGPSIRHTRASWPTVIQWQPAGEFAMFYRATRWDELYQCCADDHPWKSIQKRLRPKVHVLECIRWLEYDWGTLPETGLEHASRLAILDPSRREYRLLHYIEGERFFLTRDTPFASPLLEAPRVVVQYLLLFYFSTLARYHALQWQELLAGATEPEGGVLRVALDRVATDFAVEMTRLLPRPHDNSPSNLPIWYDQRPDFDKPYQPSQGPTGHLITIAPGSRLSEWEGTPVHSCTKDQAIRTMRQTPREIQT